MSISEVHDEVPANTESADEELEAPMFIEPPSPMFIEPPALEDVAPLNAAIRMGGTRRSCYGWLSDSEDDEEEQPTGKKH